MENRINETNEVKGRCVYAAPIARDLIRREHRIIDIKPNQENHDMTVFVFAETDEFNRDLENALNKYKAKKERKRLNRMAREICLNKDIDAK